MDLLPLDEYVRSLPRRHLAGGVLFRSPDGRVLLVEPSYKQNWDIPGGVVDAGESPWAAAVREVREEIGLDVTLGPLLVIDNTLTNARMPESVAFVWDGGTITDAEVDALTFPDPEIVSAGLHTLNEMTDKVGPIVGRRIAAAVTAAQAGALLLCNDGTPA